MTKVTQICAEELKLEALELLFQSLLKQGDKVCSIRWALAFRECLYEVVSEYSGCKPTDR